MIKDASKSADQSTPRLASRRYLALWFPFLSADRLRHERERRNPAERDERPLVIVEKVKGALKLFAADAEAVRLGLERGLTLADARARIPGLAVAEADPEADSRFLMRLAELCGRYTPLIALDPPDGLVLDITGCAHLFGGEASLRRQACARLNPLGLHVRATVAGTPEAARALARFGRVAIAPPGGDEALVRPLPVSALGVGSETVDALSRAGLKTLGCLADRPSPVLVARFGQDLLTRLMRTLGREDSRITPLRPVPACIAERHFPEPMTQAAALEMTLEALIGEAARRMEERGEGGRVFEASFFRSDGVVQRIVVETGRPSRDAGAILRLYRERLDTLADPIDPGFGFDAIRVAVPVTEPLTPLQQHLEERTVESKDEAVGELIDRLTARLGRDRVLRFEALDSHDPDREMRLVPAAAGASSAKPASGSWPSPEPGEPPARPVQIFTPPQPIETLAEVPDGPPLRFRWRRVLHEIASAEGPERILPEWWREGCDAEARDYYRVEDQCGRRFWIFREGLYGQDRAHPRWFLHGLFA